MPEQLDIAVDTEARVRFVVDNLHADWAPLAAQLRAATSAGRQLSAEMLEWVLDDVDAATARRPR